MKKGIYTLANDVVYEQLVALLNSIEANAHPSLPVCVIPYDNRLDKVRAEVARRGDRITMLDDESILQRWEEFVRSIWQANPTVIQDWREKGITDVNRMGMHRRFCAFDEASPFEQFIFFDADVLVLNSLAEMFTHLDHHDFVVYDFQHKDPSHVYNIHSPKLNQIFPAQRINTDIFCAGFYVAKRGLFPARQRDWLLKQLQCGEAEILYPNGPDQSILNYMVMRTPVAVHNLAFHLPATQKTGNTVTSLHFEERDRRLYDKGAPLTYLHYIGISASVFNALCAGENIEFPYRDLFLHYRYLYEPETMPSFTDKPRSYKPSISLKARILKKLKLG